MGDGFYFILLLRWRENGTWRLHSIGLQILAADRYFYHLLTNVRGLEIELAWLDGWTLSTFIMFLL